MRRALVLLVVALAAAVAGCQESGFDEARETRKPLTVQHALGESKVPGRAERPLPFTVDALDDTLALGLEPSLAVLPGARLPAYLRPQARGLKVISQPLPPSLAPIKAADPDVILASVPAQTPLYGRLRKIAPTVMSDAAGVGWKLNARLHGEALGRTNDAERLLIDYDGRSARLRRLLGARAGRLSVAVVRVGQDTVRVAAEQSFPGSVVGDLGVSLAEAGADEGREYRTVAPKRPPALEADVVLVGVAPGGEARWRQLASRPEWQRARVVRVDEGAWWSGGGILAARAALRDLTRALAS
jgi:iron complex transport system substrate-binding protein